MKSISHEPSYNDLHNSTFKPICKLHVMVSYKHPSVYNSDEKNIHNIHSDVRIRPCKIQIQAARIQIQPNLNPAQKCLNPDSTPNPDSDLHITDPHLRKYAGKCGLISSGLLAFACQMRYSDLKVDCLSMSSDIFINVIQTLLINVVLLKLCEMIYSTNYVHVLTDNWHKCRWLGSISNQHGHKQDT